MAKPAPMFGWKITVMHAGQIGQRTISLLSHSSPIYLADTTRAWLDLLPRNSINCWEDHNEIFTGNFQGTYM
jgi:hypothetical protein